MQVARIFTGRSISPSLPPRQRASRYTFRAGRNLPDKEFRYLRTVIVTAAVHRGFGRPLAQALLTFRHWAGVGPHMLSCDFAETCVFGKQSPAPIPAAVRHPFSLSYETILPSSLGGVISLPLVFSTCHLCRFWYKYVAQIFLGALNSVSVVFATQRRNINLHIRQMRLSASP